MEYIVKTERHILNKGHPMFKMCREYCRYSKNLYNFALYQIRQEYIKEGKYIGNYVDMGKSLKREVDFKAIGSNSGQQTLKLLDRVWKSFFAGLKEYNKNPSKFLGRPQLPKYLKKDGEYVWVLTNVQSKIVDGYLRFSFTPLKPFNNLIKTNVTDKHCETRIVPKGSYYVLEIVYKKPAMELKPENRNIIGIDLGLNNLMSIQNNIGLKPIVINGKPLKSFNSYYNRKKSKMQSELKKVNGSNWSTKLSNLTLKRNSKIGWYLHNSSKYVVNYCLENNIDTVVIGKNDKWKQDFKNQKNFVQIPLEHLINQLQYKLREIGVHVIMTEESYTSKASFLDRDEMKKDVDFSGKRIKRGLYKTNCGTLINADINGAGNIIRKVFPNAFDGVKGVGLHPVIINM